MPSKLPAPDAFPNSWSVVGNLVVLCDHDESLSLLLPRPVHLLLAALGQSCSPCPPAAWGGGAALPGSLCSYPPAAWILPLFFRKSHGLEYFTIWALHLRRSCPITAEVVNNKNALSVSCWLLPVSVLCPHSPPTQEKDVAGEPGRCRWLSIRWVAAAACQLHTAPGMLVRIPRSGLAGSPP